MSKAIPIRLLVFITVLLVSSQALVCADESGAKEKMWPDRSLEDYLSAETAKISANGLSNISSLADWQARRPELRRKAAEMLGLEPMPPRTALNPVVTGKLEQEDFTVEKLQFQSRPHLYVTANLYLPKPLSKPVPAVLYLCGHTAVVTNGVSCGNKTAYQQHGIWFARNGYVCLVLDTLELGEIRGIHHGTYNQGMWWWNSRGYTPAGVETWNAIRALDYLDSRPEVDRNRIGVTGRSGGGAYSWFVAALDDRVKVIAPVAGIADLQNYVVNGTVDGHCDCMFFVNTYRWDYPLLADLCAPRPLLLANSDADPLFPLDGVLRTRNAIQRIYGLYGEATNFGLTISPGPHKDTQDLQIPVFRWFNIHLKNQDPVIAMAAEKKFSPEQLKVFDKLPKDQINTTIQQSFVPSAETPEIPLSSQAWKQMKETWMKGLREKCFAAWPDHATPPTVKRTASENLNGIQCETYQFQSQTNVWLELHIMSKSGHGKPGRVILHVADETLIANAIRSSSAATQNMSIFGTTKEVAQLTQEVQKENVAYAMVFLRETALTGGMGGESRETGLRRRMMLLGQTLDGMRVWDIRRTAQAVQSIERFRASALELEAEGNLGVDALYASLFEPEIRVLRLHHIPSSHMEGPDYLNVLKILDIPQAAAMAAEHCELQLQVRNMDGWEFLRAMTSCPVTVLRVQFVAEPRQSVEPSGSALFPKIPGS